MKTTLKKTLALLVFATALGGASILKAQTFSFNVDIDTSALVSATATGPYSLDFQLNYGGTPAPSNTATVTGFIFTGGTPTGSAVTFNSASGDLSSSVSLTADSTNSFNELYQGFSQSTSDIKFTVTLSQNGSGLTPTGFNVAILDNTLSAIATTDTGDAPNYTVLTVPLSTANHLADIQTFSSTSPAGVVTTVSAVPEPSTWAMVLLGGGVMVVTLHLRRKTA